MYTFILHLLISCAINIYIYTDFFIYKLNLMFSIIFFGIGMKLLLYGSHLIYFIPWSKKGMIPPSNWNSGPGSNGNGNGSPNPHSPGWGDISPQDLSKIIYSLRKRSHLDHHVVHKRALNSAIQNIKTYQTINSSGRRRGIF